MSDLTPILWLAIGIAIGLFVGWILFPSSQPSAIEKKSQSGKKELETIKSIVQRIESLENRVDENRSYTDKDIFEMRKKMSYGAISEKTGLNISQIRYRIKKCQKK